MLQCLGVAIQPITLNQARTSVFFYLVVAERISCERNFPVLVPLSSHLLHSADKGSYLVNRGDVRWPYLIAGLFYTRLGDRWALFGFGHCKEIKPGGRRRQLAWRRRAVLVLFT